MADLHREGWIERRQGRGTFIGPARRLRSILGRPMASMHRGGSHASPTWFTSSVIFSMTGTPAILEGMDKAAADMGVSIELLW